MAYQGNSVTHSHFCSTTKRPSAPWSQTTMPVPWHAGQSGFALGFCSIVGSPIRLCHWANLSTNLTRKVEEGQRSWRQPSVPLSILKPLKCERPF
jgi:hypothetical protein